MISFVNKLKDSLKKTRTNVSSKIQNIFSSGKGLTEEMLESLEETLITADLGVDTAMMLIEAVRERFAKEKDVVYKDVLDILKEKINLSLAPVFNCRSDKEPPDGPYVILVVGVHGTGKTTSIGKLANYYKSMDKRVMLAASDTFRAAAVEQLEVWKDRIGVEIVKNVEGTDPAAVAFDAAQSAIARGVDVLIVDTAGRIHTNVNLMQELGKIKRVVSKVIPDAPHKTILTIDSNMGQNAISQARLFTDTVRIDSIFLTKLDGTAKGGAAIPIMKELEIPIEFIGTGEQKEDMQVFYIKEFTEALFSE